MIANELAWWVDPDYRGKDSLELFSAYEYWATKIMNCKTVSTISRDDPRLDTYYKRKKYTLQEKLWNKEFV